MCSCVRCYMLFHKQTSKTEVLLLPVVSLHLHCQVGDSTRNTLGEPTFQRALSQARLVEGVWDHSARTAHTACFKGNCWG